jgi:hypothetical protein
MARASRPTGGGRRRPSVVVLLLLILVVSAREGTNASKGTIAAYDDNALAPVVLAREDGPADAAPANDDVTAEGEDGDTMVTTMTTMITLDM